MEPSFISLSGMKVASYERPGNGTPIVFLHGSSSNTHAFEQMFASDYLRNFRLLAFDLPGHGYSDWPDDPANYTVLSQSKRVAAFIEMMKLQNAILVGHSLGGHMACHVLEFTDRIEGIMLIGASPLEHGDAIPKGYNLSEEIMTFFKAEATAEELDKALLLEVFERKYEQVIRDSYKITDGRTRDVMGVELSTYFVSPEFKSEVKLLGKPGLKVAIVAGEHETIVNTEYLDSLRTKIKLWRDRVQVIAGTKHCSPFEAPERTAKLLSEFANEIRLAK